MNLDDWLAAAPSADEIMDRLAELATETRRLQTLLARLYPDAGVPNRERGGRMSPERKAIIDAVRAGHHTPEAVAEFLSKDPNPVGVNMSRMVRFGMLVRVVRGYYQVPDAALSHQPEHPPSERNAG